MTDRLIDSEEFARAHEVARALVTAAISGSEADQDIAYRLYDALTPAEHTHFVACLLGLVIGVIERHREAVSPDLSLGAVWSKIATGLEARHQYRLWHDGRHD